MSASTFEDVGMKGSPEPSTLPEPFQGEQTMLILVGLIASGKSTFAEALESHFPIFRRCNQDDLGSRQQVEELASSTLSEGRSPCIDRTNFNAIQRSYWSAIARAFPGTSISIIVFDTPYHVCASRLERRTSHPTIRDARHGMTILRKFASEFSMPSPDEGYDHLIHLQPADHPRAVYTRDDILSILARLRASSSTRGDGTSNGRMYSKKTHFGRGESHHSRKEGARGYRRLSSTRGFISRVRDSNSPTTNWRWRSTDMITNHERSDHRSISHKAPAKEGSREGNSAEQRHNSS